MENLEEPTVDEVEVVEAVEFKTLTEANAAYSELNKTSEALLDEAQQKIEALEAGAEESKAAIAEAIEKLEEAESKVAEAQSTIEKLEGEQQSAERKAAAIAASVGVDPVSVETEESNDGLSLVDQYNALSGAARTKFYQDNEENFLASL